MASGKIRIEELRSLVKEVMNENDAARQSKTGRKTLSEGIRMGDSKEAQSAANTLNMLVAKIDRPDLQSKARALASQLVTIIDEDKKS